MEQERDAMEQERDATKQLNTQFLSDQHELERDI
jgi:hypothetical protein